MLNLPILIIILRLEHHSPTHSCDPTVLCGVGAGIAIPSFMRHITSFVSFFPLCDSFVFFNRASASFICIIQSCYSDASSCTPVLRWLEFSQSFQSIVRHRASSLGIKFQSFRFGIHSAHGDQSWLISFFNQSVIFAPLRMSSLAYQAGFNSVSNSRPQLLTFLLFTTTYLSLSGALTMCSVVTPCWRELCGA
jgi:hypothetical protein